jgi:signal peptidase II
MQKGNHLQGKWRNVSFFLPALLVVTADQLSKIWIRSYPEEQVIFKAGFFQIIHTHNTGAAFGLFQGQSFALTIVGLVSVTALLAYAIFFYRHFPLLNNRLSNLALGLILGGTLGNLIDRLNPNLGGVTDFISIGIWPTFNIADSAVVVGTIIFAYTLLRLAQTEKH